MHAFASHVHVVKELSEHEVLLRVAGDGGAPDYDCYEYSTDLPPCVSKID